MLTRPRALIVVALLLVLAAWQVRTQSQTTTTVTSPLQAFGSNIGDDYFLATYTQLEQYWKKPSIASPTGCRSSTSVEPKRDAPSGWRSSRRQRTSRRSIATAASRGNLALAEGLSDEQARVAGATRERRSSGSMAGCTRTRCSARSS